MNKLTIFTPTYNRKELIKECYKSLQNQTNKNFEWLIIDDGSTDNTEDYINDISKIANFKINYIYKENGGKNSAHNLAVTKCTTPFFLILDSDDILEKNAVDIIYDYLIKIENLDNISGIIGNKISKTTKKIIGTPMPNIEYITGLELYQKYKFKGDTLRIYKTSILENNLFPEINEEKFIPENVVFDKIDLNYKMLAIKDLIYECEYQEEGYSKNIYKIRHDNPIGYSLSLKSAAETAVSFKKKINWTILYIIWCKRMKIKSFKFFKNKILYVLLYPIALSFNLIKYPKFLFLSIRGEKN